MSDIQTPETPVDFTKTPEFAAAVAAAAQAQAGAMLDAMRASLLDDLKKAQANAQPTPTDPTGMTSVISDLAVAIASMADTGDNRKKIAPEEAAQRMAAHERMGHLIMEARAKKLQPVYQLVTAVVIDDQRIEPFIQQDNRWIPQRIIWTGAPSSAMRPLNDPAKAIFAEYLRSIGGTTKNQAGVNEKPQWVSEGGLVMVGDPPQSIQNRGLASFVTPAQLAEMGNLETLGPTREVTTNDDPNSPTVAILGTRAEKAKRTVNGDVVGLIFPNQR